MSRAKRKAIQKRRNTATCKTTTTRIDTERMSETGETIARMIEAANKEENFSSVFTPTVGISLFEIPKEIAVQIFENALPQIRSEVASGNILEDVKKSNTVVIRLT